MLLCIMFLASTLWLSGACTSARDLNELVIVVGIGMDKEESDPEMINLIAQIVLPGKISTPEGGGSSEDPYYNLSSASKSTFEAVREYTHMVSGKLYTAHAEIFVIGRELAEHGIAHHLDFFLRAKETRPTSKIVISDTTAIEVLSITPKLGVLPASNINKLIDVQIANSQSIAASLLDFVNAMQSKTFSFMAPIVTIMGENGEKVVHVTGMAVFKQDKMVGKLSEDETRGVLWVTGEVKSSVIVVDIGGGLAAIEVLSAKSDVKPNVADGKVTMKIEVNVATALGEQTNEENLATQDNLKKLKTLAENTICNEIAMAYNRAASLHADVFGFGELIHKHNNEDWKDMEPKWEELFPEITLDITVNVDIKSAGAVEEPVWFKDEG